tara:strand:+ start:171 stop:527 length:357 start_codon:yes stop_codon:yes gene_type:complete
MNKLELTGTTTGTGYWTAAKDEKVTGYMTFTLLESDGETFGGNAQFHFNKEDWDVHELGLIYTDEGFLDDVYTTLEQSGFKNILDHINYSEQGMQGDDYVDFDASIELVKEAQQLGFA